MKINLPELCLVVLIGASGSGKSSFARRHFKPTEVISSDFCRGLVSDDEVDQSVTKDAFEIVNFIGAKRLANAKLTVIDATNVQAEARKPLLALAKDYHVLPVAIVLNLPEKICIERNRLRSDRNFGEHVIRQQKQNLRSSLRNLQAEGFRHVWTLTSLEDVENTVIERQPLWNNRKNDHGPFDVIGDIHGCYDELAGLLTKLGYEFEGEGAKHPTGRKAVFVGDLVDRGPKVPAVLRLVMNMVKTGNALCVPGNHDIKLMRKLNGKDVQIKHGLAETLSQLQGELPSFKREIATFIDDLVSHYVLDEGKLVVAHAGLKAEYQGRAAGKVRDFALYGETTGETDEFGLPIRYDWASEYRGKATVVYGHTPVPTPEWLNNTINVDTGCVYGGKLTALRYPEKELVSVEAAQIYYESVKPFLTITQEAMPSLVLNAQQQNDDLLDIEDVLGKRQVETRLYRNVTIREENAIAALEVMSRFAINPKWLIYLPPTMSPSETTKQPDLLEHPAEAFGYYVQQGVTKVVCEQKHMGSRAMVLICQDEKVASKRFGIQNEGFGVCYTRTGRRFFDPKEAELEKAFLNRVRTALYHSNFWNKLDTDWVLLDCELMPWSAKAQELVRHQYAAVGAASQASLKQVVETLTVATERDESLATVLEHYKNRQVMANQYVEAYRHYCWPVHSIDDLKLAPFHLLATEGQVHIHQNHVWHMETLAGICEVDPALLLKTPYKVVELADEQSRAEAIDWWEELTTYGGEGMVVKPFDFVTMDYKGRSILQPAIKCRGKEYLRIIYGPEYTAPQNLQRLRQRGISGKRSLALREFALGIEGLERFIRHEPLRKVHECVFGVLALESEPIDPRL